MKIPLVVILVSFVFGAVAQNELKINREGIPPMTKYSGQDYDGHNQVWDIIQDQLGLIYVAATYGLHEFDGVDWRKIKTKDGVVPRCFASNEAGRIYVSGNGIFGFLSNNDSGLTQFRSLQGHLPDSLQSVVGGLAHVLAFQSKAFFSGLNCVLVYDETTERLQYFATEHRAFPAFELKGKAFFNMDGLVVYENDNLLPAKSGHYFKGKELTDFVSSGDTAVIGLSTSKVYHFYDGDTAYVKAQPVINDLKDKRPYRILSLPNDYYVTSYLDAGAVITDHNSTIILRLDETAGIDNEVHKSYMDAQQNLWLATNNGLVLVELASRTSMLGQSQGLFGEVTGIIEENDRLLVATTTGIYSKSWKQARITGQDLPDKFEKIARSDIYNDGFLSGSSPPLIRAYESIGQVIGEKYQTIVSKPGGFQSQAIYIRDSIYALMPGGSGSELLLFQHDGDRWQLHRKIMNEVLPKTIYNLKYDQDNDLIWGANVSELFSFEISDDLTMIKNYRSYKEADGLSQEGMNFAITFGNELIFSTPSGIYQWNPSLQKFVESEIFDRFFEKSRLGELSIEDDSTFWYFDGTLKKGMLQKTSTGWKVDTLTSQLLPVPTRVVHHSPGRGTIYGGMNRISFLQAGKQEDFSFGFRPLVRRLELITGKDSTIFYGSSQANKVDDTYESEPIMVLPYEQNAVRLSYAVPYFRHPGQITYQYLLKGFDQEWSEWTKNTYKEYTNLPAGDYVFLVSAKNGFDTKSKNGALAFSIDSPWYGAWWAIMIYIFVLIIIILIVVRLNARRLMRKNLELEETIKERVIEIEEQKDIIAKSLVEKESLLKEIHHRVKNNLQIIASLLYLQSGKFENEDFKRVLEEGQGRVRSMALIHQKLYENDDLKSIPFEEYLKELIHEIRSSFGMNEVILNITAEDVFFDVDTAVPLGLIVNELATNAFKYAFENGKKGTFNISLIKQGEKFMLNVSDDGVGIPDEIDIMKTRSLGLRLVRMLSQQLEGQFSFEGKEGTKFELKFAA